MSRKDSGSAGPFMGSSRGGAPCSKQRRPPGLRKSDTPPRGTSGYALPYSSIFRPVPIPLNDRQPPPRGRPRALRWHCKRRNSPVIDYIDWYCRVRRRFERARSMAIAVSPSL